MKKARVGGRLLVILLMADHIALYFWGMALHLWTCYIAYQTGSFVVTLLSFFLPVFAETVWFITIWYRTGFLNWYTLGVLGWVALVIPVFVSIWRAEDGGRRRR